DSLSVQEWIQLRQKMLSREFALNSIDVYVDELVANSLLYAIHGVKFEWKKSWNHLDFYSNEDEKSILYRTFDRHEGCQFSIYVIDGLFLTKFDAIKDPQFNGMIRFGMRLKWCRNEEEGEEIREKCQQKILPATPHTVPPIKKRVCEIVIKMFNVGFQYPNFSLVIDDGRSCPEFVYLNKFIELKKKLKKCIKFTTCNTISLQTKTNIDEKDIEIIHLLSELDADQVEIKPREGEKRRDQCDPSALFDRFDYNFLHSITRNRTYFDVDFEFNSISVHEWIEFRQKMLSREISLSYLSIRLHDSSVNSLIFTLHDITISRVNMENRHSSLKFFSKDEGKTVLYAETPRYESIHISFSIIFIDGLFITEFFGIRQKGYIVNMKWCENEEEVNRLMWRYKTVTAIKE
ncbi:hypothetical protein PFISCL1PPCAC_19187, partial [Pristionchus fissidentatus]